MQLSKIWNRHKRDLIYPRALMSVLAAAYSLPDIFVFIQPVTIYFGCFSASKTELKMFFYVLVGQYYKFADSLPRFIVHLYL